MENIKNLNPAEFMELIHIWCEGRDDRCFIGSIGQSEDIGINSSVGIVGKGKELIVMLANLLEQETDLTVDAMKLNLNKKLSQKMERINSKYNS